MVKVKVKLKSADTEPPGPEPPSITKRRKQRNKENDRERARLYRERVRADPEKSQEEKEKNAVRKRRARASMTDEQRAAYREKSKIRQQRHRDKKKREGTTGNGKGAVTRGEKEKRREKWRELKQQERARMPSQKKRRIKEKDKMRKRAKKEEQMKESHSSTSTGQSKSSIYHTDSARRKAVSRVKGKMPKESQKFAAVLDSIIVSATPTKKQALEERGIISCRKKINFVKNLPNLFQSPEKTEKTRKTRRAIAASLSTLKKYRLLRTSSRLMGYSWKYLMKHSKSGGDHSRKGRSDTITSDTSQKVGDFFKENSTVLPNMNMANEEQSGGVLDESIDSMYEKFKSENPHDKIGRTKFFSMRPSQILTSKQRHLIQCLCEYCANVRECLNVINKSCQKQNLPNKALTSEAALNKTLCLSVSDTAIHSDCVYRACEQCGVSGLREHFADVVDASRDQEVTYYQWQYERVVVDGKVSSRHNFNPTTTILAEAVDHLCDLMNPHAQHIFTAKYQQRVYKDIKNNIPERTVVSVIDFAENFATFFQNAVQSVHWQNTQVTLFPMVTWYECPTCPDHQVIRDYLVFLSNDKRHISHSVHAFQCVAYKFLRETRQVEFNRIVEFSDGCSGQFKSKIPFADISFSQSDLDGRLERHFFGSRHGKNDSDGTAAVVKSAVRRAIMTRRAVISTPMEMFHFCEDKMTLPEKVDGKCMHVRRKFFFVSKDDIDHQRLQRQVKTAVSGTRKLHSVRCVSPGVVATKNLSCFCPSCWADDPIDSECPNKEHVRPWQITPLQMTYPIENQVIYVIDTKWRHLASWTWSPLAQIITCCQCSPFLP